MKDTSAHYVIGLDIGGSHITAALLDLGSTNLLTDVFSRRYVDSMVSADMIFDTWMSAIQSIYKRHRSVTRKIGIAMPGPFDYEKGISMIHGQGKYESLYGLNIKEHLSARLDIDVEDIRMMNDASCFLRGEVFGGAVKNYERIAGVTLGTGLGSAIHHAGVTTDAELWNMPFRDSIAEEYTSTRWFVARYRELSGKAVANVKELAVLARHDAYAMKVFTEFGRYLGEFLSAFIARDQPQAVVVGGNIARSAKLFMTETKDVLKENSITVPVFQSVLGESSALIGAGSLWSTDINMKADLAVNTNE